MDVVKTASPSAMPSAATERPRNTVPSSSRRKSLTIRPRPHRESAAFSATTSSLVRRPARSHRHADDALEPLAEKPGVHALGAERCLRGRPVRLEVDEYEVRGRTDL